MEQNLPRRNYKKILWKWFGLPTVTLIGLLVLSMSSLLLYCYILGAPSLQHQENTVFYSHSQEVMAVEHGLENRYWISLDEMSPDFIQATLQTEDRRFYKHFGFDIKRIVAAALHDIKAMSKVQGASTITQQYARNLYLSHEKTWARKVKEAIYALRLEMFYDKEKILEGYLNTIYYGHGAYGIEAASRYYFHKNADELTLSEAALLAAVPKGPSYYSPYSHFDNAKRRQELILSNMHKGGKISDEELLEAKQEPIKLASNPSRSKKDIAPYFQDLVMKEAMKKIDMDAEEIKSGGLHIYTTLDISKQQKLERTIRETIDAASEMQIGAMSMNPQTGAVLSMVGGRDYEESPFNRAVQAKRMPGSTFKPFLYYAALENGYTPATTLMSRPTYFELENGSVYEPSNYNGYYAYEPITLAQAIALSDNVYAVKTNVFLGEETLVETAKRMGIESSLPAVPSLALGTASVSVKEMVGAYSVIANGGKEVDPYTVEKITDAHGHVLYEREQEKKKQVIDPSLAFVLTHLMTGMFDESLNDYMRVTGSSIASDLTRTYAGKSGTTRTDSWMVGFSPKVTTGIWTGYDQNKPIEKMKEHQYAKDIWAEYMEGVHGKQAFEAFKPSEGVVGVYIDPNSGHLATPYCPNQRLAYFVEGTEPEQYCDVHLPDGTEGYEKVEKKDKKKPKSISDVLDWLF